MNADMASALVYGHDSEHDDDHDVKPIVHVGSLSSQYSIQSIYSSTAALLNIIVSPKAGTRGPYHCLC